MRSLAWLGGGQQEEEAGFLHLGFRKCRLLPPPPPPSYLPLHPLFYLVLFLLFVLARQIGPSSEWPGTDWSNSDWSDTVKLYSDWSAHGMTLFRVPITLRILTRFGLDQGYATPQGCTMTKSTQSDTWD